MNVGLWFTEDNYTGYTYPSSGFTNVSGSIPGSRCANKLGRGFFKGDPGAIEIARLNNLIVADKYQIGNEPNLKFEGNWDRPTYRQRFLEVRALMPGKKLGYAGMSPNNGPDTQGGWFLDWYSDAVGVADFVVGHIYGQTVDVLVNLCNAILGAIHPLDMCIGELNFGPGPGVYLDKNVWAQQVLRPFLFDYVIHEPRITDVIYFADTWKADTPIGTSVDARGTQILDVLAEAAVVNPDELQQFINDIWKRAGVPLNPQAALYKYWRKQLVENNRYFGRPEGPEHPISGNKFIVQEFGSQILWARTTDFIVKEGLPPLI